MNGRIHPLHELGAGTDRNERYLGLKRVLGAISERKQLIYFFTASSGQAARYVFVLKEKKLETDKMNKKMFNIDSRDRKV